MTLDRILTVHPEQHVLVDDGIGGDDDPSRDVISAIVVGVSASRPQAWAAIPEKLSQSHLFRVVGQGKK
jgi:hypothetical protein